MGKDDFDFLFSEDTPAEEMTPKVEEKPEDKEPEVEVQPEQKPAEEAPGENEVHVFEGLEGENQTIVWSQINIVRNQCIRLIESMRTFLESLNGLEDLVGVPDGSQPAEEVATQEESPQTTEAGTEDPGDAERVAKGGPPLDAELLGVLKDRSIKGLGKGKMASLCAMHATVGAFFGAIKQARAAGKPDHAFMPNGVGHDIVSGIIDEIGTWESAPGE